MTFKHRSRANTAMPANFQSAWISLAKVLLVYFTSWHHSGWPISMMPAYSQLDHLYMHIGYQHCAKAR